MIWQIFLEKNMPVICFFLRFWKSFRSLGVFTIKGNLRHHLASSRGLLCHFSILCEFFFLWKIITCRADTHSDTVHYLIKSFSDVIFLLKLPAEKKLFIHIFLRRIILCNVQKMKNVCIENKTFILEFYECSANCIKLLIFQKLNWFGTRFLSFSRLLRSVFFCFGPFGLFVLLISIATKKEMFKWI